MSYISIDNPVNIVREAFAEFIRDATRKRTLDEQLDIFRSGILDSPITNNNPVFKFGIVHGEVIHYDAPYAKRDVITIDNRTTYDNQPRSVVIYNTPKYVPIGIIPTNTQ